VVYFFNYIVGSSQNRGIAESWLETCRQKLEDNFHIIGIDNKGKLDRESASQYKLYCSGCVARLTVDHVDRDRDTDRDRDRDRDRDSDSDIDRDRDSERASERESEREGGGGILIPGR
jgi:hypothetical protein